MKQSEIRAQVRKLIKSGQGDAAVKLLCATKTDWQTASGLIREICVGVGQGKTTLNSKHKVFIFDLISAAEHLGGWQAVPRRLFSGGENQ